LAVSRPPYAVLKEARLAAKALAKVVEGKPHKLVLNGKTILSSCGFEAKLAYAIFQRGGHLVLAKLPPKMPVSLEMFDTVRSIFSIFWSDFLVFTVRLSACDG
jgi:hypothetical protein